MVKIDQKVSEFEGSLKHMVQYEKYLFYFIYPDGTVERTLDVSWITTETSEPLLRPSTSVTQIHYTGWPDYGAPRSTKDLLDLHKIMRRIRKRIQSQENDNT